MKAHHVVELVLLAALWGGSFLCLRVASPQFGPLALIELRVGMSLLFLLPLLHYRSGLGVLKGKWGHLFLIGMLNSAVPFTLFAYTALSMSAGFGSVLNSTVPLFGALVAWLWLKDHLSVLTWLGLLLGFVGVLILVWGRISFKPGGTGLAVLAALLATFLYGFSANYVKKMASGIPSLALAAGSMVTATLMLLPFAIAFWPSTPPDLKAWAAVLVLAFACTGLAYILYFRLITQVGPTRTITVTFLIPVFGMLWGWLFLSEPITLQMILGCGVILFGTALTTGVLNVPRVKSRP